MENKKQIQTMKNGKALTIITWTIILGAWYIVTEWDMVSSTLVPSPSKVIQTFLTISQDGYNKISLWQHLLDSFERLFLALGIAIATGVPVGLLSGYSNKFKAIVDSVVEFYRPLPLLLITHY